MPTGSVYGIRQGGRVCTERVAGGYLMQIEPLTADELGLLQYMIWRYRNDCHHKMGTLPQDSISHQRAKNDLAVLSEIERKLEVIT
jgi:hypothetical protein